MNHSLLKRNLHTNLLKFFIGQLIQMLQILNAEPLNYCETAREILCLLGNYHEYVLTRAELLDCISNYNVLIVRLGFQIDKEIINKAKKLKFIVTPTTGLNHIDIGYAKKRNIQILSLQGQSEFLKEVRATAELTVGLALSLIRHIPSAIELTKNGKWDRDSFRGNELYEKTAGIVGMGRLGKIVAGYLRSFGMNILAYDPFVDFSKDLADHVDNLNDLLIRSDLITLHVCYNDAARHLLGENEFAKMKSTAFLVNTSRGGIIDEAALLNALKTGRLAGAALDVLDIEPNITKDHPLLLYSKKYNNLIIVPHIGGNTYESFTKTEIFMANQLKYAVQRELNK